MKSLRFVPTLLSKISLVLLIQIVAIPTVALSSARAVGTPAHQELPVNNTVTMIDLGAKTCIPCKLMAPILEELRIEYEGRAAVIFIDVREDRSQGKRFGVLSIPTQIFYDKHGKEVYRHTGFLSKDKIKNRLDRLIETK